MTRCRRRDINTFPMTFSTIVWISHKLYTVNCGAQNIFMFENFKAINYTHRVGLFPRLAKKWILSVSMFFFVFVNLPLWCFSEFRVPNSYYTPIKAGVLIHSTVLQYTCMTILFFDILTMVLVYFHYGVTKQRWDKYHAAEFLLTW